MANAATVFSGAAFLIDSTAGLNSMWKIPSERPRAQISDSQREQVIHRCHRRLVAASDMSTKAAAWRLMRRLIRQRSPKAIAKLEAERGLVRPS